MKTVTGRRLRTATMTAVVISRAFEIMNINNEIATTQK